MATMELKTEDFTIIDDVPIFSEAVDQDSEGRETIVDAVLLEKIAEVNNNRVAMGEPGVIHVGHSDPEGDEKPVLGFLTEFTTGIRNGIATLFARLLVYPECVDKLKQFPRRSIEILNSDVLGYPKYTIPNMALLGSSAPAVASLGVMYSLDKKHIVKFSADKFSAESLNTLEDTEKKMVPDELKQQILEVLAETDVFAYIHEMMKSKAELSDEEGKEKMEGEVVEEAKAPEDKAPEDGEAKSEEEIKDEGTDKEVEKENTEEEVAIKEDEAADEKKNKETYSLEEVETLKFQLRRSEREKQLMVLEGEGCVFDMAEELGDCEEMNDQQFLRHLGRIQKFSKKAPITKKFSIANVNSGGDVSSGQLNEAKIKQIKDYAQVNKISFQQAFSKFKNS